MRKLFSYTAIIITLHIQAQEVYYHLHNSGIYEFLDELTNVGIIDLNTAVKPYSRLLIADKLREAEVQRISLNKRQQQELDFYHKDFGKEIGFYGKKKRLDLLYYSDSTFSITANPVGGIVLYKNSHTDYYHRWNGAEVYGWSGKHLALYSSLRDNYESLRMADPYMLSDRPGAVYRHKGKGGEYSEARGGISYSWHKGSIAIVKDHFAWGNNYHGSNIFSGRPPSFAQVKFVIRPARWLDLHYIHGWMVSEVPDSSRSYYFSNSYGIGRRDVFTGKYLAANFISIKPLSRTRISIGNSIVYSDNVQAAYLIPVLFYKSVDHNLSGMSRSGRNTDNNSQMFADFSFRQIKHVHLYSTIFIDEISLIRFFDKNNHSNFISGKGGVRISGIPANSSMTFEYTRSNPLVYKHIVPTTTFESNRVNLGHYLLDNSEEIYGEMSYRPFRALLIRLSYMHAVHGSDHTRLASNRWGLPFMDTAQWLHTEYSLLAQYQIINDVYVHAQVAKSNIRGNEIQLYTPAFMQGKQQTVSAGVNIGF